MMTAGTGNAPTKSGRRRRGGRRVAWIAAALVVLVGVVWGRQVVVGGLIVGLIAVFLAYLTAPFARLLTRRVRLGGRRRRFSRRMATLLVLGGVSAAVVSVWWLFGPRIAHQFDRFLLTAPGQLHLSAVHVRAAERVLARVALPAALRPWAAMLTERFLAGLIAHAVQALGEIQMAAHYLRWLAVTPVLAYLLLVYQPAFRHTTVPLLPSAHLRWRSGQFLHDVNVTLAAYVRVQLTASLIVGSLCSAGFALLGVPNPLVTGAAAGALEILPFVGPLAVAVLASSLQPVRLALAVLLFLGVLRAIQDYAIYPRLIQRGMHLPALVVIGVIWAGTEVGGLAGAFLAIPLAGVVAVTFRHWREYRDIERLVRGAAD